MSLQAIRVASGQAETVGGVRPAHDDLGSRGTDRKSEVIYPVPLSIRIIHTMWVAGIIGVIMMLLFG